MHAVQITAVETWKLTQCSVNRFWPELVGERMTGWMGVCVSEWVNGCVIGYAVRARGSGSATLS